MTPRPPCGQSYRKNYAFLGGGLYLPKWVKFRRNFERPLNPHAPFSGIGSWIGSQIGSLISDRIFGVWLSKKLYVTGMRYSNPPSSVCQFFLSPNATIFDKLGFPLHFLHNLCLKTIQAKILHHLFLCLSRRKFSLTALRYVII